MRRKSWESNNNEWNSKTFTYHLTFTCSKSTPFSSVSIVEFEQVNVNWVTLSFENDMAHMNLFFETWSE